MKKDGNILQPTLWRTCRCVANRTRLKILRELLARPNQSVKQIGLNLSLSESVASLSLRALNARGVLSAFRIGKHVFYAVEANLSIQGCFELLEALRQVFHSDKNAAELVFRQATAFTHPRRIEIIRTLQKKPFSAHELSGITGISQSAMGRHLKKLEARGFICASGKKFLLCAPRDKFSRTLIRLTKRIE